MPLGKITKNFTWIEAACKDGTEVPENLVDNVMKVAEQAEIIRKELGNEPLHVISWYRTVAWNKKKKGAKYSQHLKAKAIDFVHDKLSPSAVYTILDALMSRGVLKQGGLGIYNTFVHYDIRETKARWDKRT